MPLPDGFGAGSETCALAHTTVINRQIRIALNRQMLFIGDIDQKTFQQGTFGPDEMVKIRVADETPAAKN
jgi:hypothetical protein